MKRKSVRPFFGWWGVVFVIGVFTILGIWIDALTQVIHGQELITSGWVMIFLAPLILFATPFLFLSAAVRIDSRGVSRNYGVLGNVYVQWDNVKRVENSNSYICLHLKEPVKNKSLVGIQTDFFANSHQLTKAIVEAATQANPSVEIDPALLSTYGPPPYGIFNLKE